MLIHGTFLNKPGHLFVIILGVVKVGVAVPEFGLLVIRVGAHVNRNSSCLFVSIPPLILTCLVSHLPVSPCYQNINIISLWAFSY